MSAPKVCPTVPKSASEVRISGSIATGIPNALHNSSSHLRSWMLNIIVREALEYSVTNLSRPVRFQMTQESMVPASNSPLSALSLAPSTCSRIQAILDAEK